MSQESEKTIEKKLDSTLKRSRQPELQMDVERKQEREQNAEKKPQIAQIEQVGGINKVGSHSFSLSTKENIQTRLADLKDRQIRRAQQNIQQLDVVRKKVKTESPDKVQSISNRQGLVQSPRYKSYVRQKGDPEKQKADLAHSIIKIIENPPVHIKQKLLQSQILEQIYNGNKYQKQNVQKILNLFQNGVILDHSIYSQQRIKDANIDGKKEIVFYPTTVFTGQTFNKLKRSQELQVIMGHFGISKTISTVLYQQLTDFIVDYRVKSQLQHEVHQNCIKIIYWTINMKQDTQQTVKKLMWKQFSETQQNFLNLKFCPRVAKDQNWKEKFIQKNIRIILVVDQLNCLISKIRAKKYHHQNPNDIQNNYEFHISQVQKIISNSIKVFDKVVFLSSMNIQTYLLRQIQCFNDTLNLDRRIKTIHLTEKQKQQQGKLDMINFFVRIFFECFKVNKSLFDAQNLLMETQDNSRSNIELESQKRQNLIKTIVMQIYNSLISSEVFYLTQYVVQCYLKIKIDDQPAVKYIEKITSLEELKTQIKQHFQIIRKYEMADCLRQIIERFIQNFPQLKELKSQLILEIYKVFEQNQKNQLSKQTSVTISIDKIKLFHDKEKKKCIEKILERNIFRFNKAHGGQISLLIPAEVFVKYKYNDKSVIEYALDCLAELKYQTIVEGKNFEIIGEKIQYYLKKALSLGCTSLIFKDNKEKEFRKFSNFQEQYIYFKPIPQHKSESHSKDPQDKKLQKISFGNCIRNGLQIIINKLKAISPENEYFKATFYVFIPGKKEFKHSQNPKLSKEQMLENQNHVSKAIDMMMIRFSKDQKKISVNAIDVTINCRSTVINSKLEKFLKCFEEFEDKNETTITLLGQSYQIELNYYVISPQYDLIKIRHQLQKTKQNFLFGFTQHEKLETILKLKKQTNSKYKLLNEIGHLSLTRNIKVQNKSQKVVDFKVYERLSQQENFKDEIDKP